MDNISTIFMKRLILKVNRVNQHIRQSFTIRMFDNYFTIQCSKINFFFIIRYKITFKFELHHVTFTYKK